MKKTYDVRAIMARAWDIRKTAAAEIGCKVGEVVMGECLRIAWAEAEGVNAEDNALEIEPCPEDEGEEVAGGACIRCTMRRAKEGTRITVR